MFSAVKNFLTRHRRKFVISGVVVAGGILSLRYAQRKLIEYQESKAREFFERTRKTQHFETTERTCNQAIMGLAPNLIDQILRTLDTEPVLEKLRQKPDNKIELWNEVKYLAFSRLTALIYACSMLAITLRVQFNVLGGYLYKDTVSGEEKVTHDIQQNYVALLQYFLGDGVESLCALIQSKVRQVLSAYDLSKKLTLAETEQIFWSIQMAVNSDANDPSSHLSAYVYPSDVPPYTSNPLFRKMFNETVDMLESGDTSNLNSNNVSRGFSIAMDHIADFYFKPENGTQSVDVASGQDQTANDTHVAETTMSNIRLVSIPLPKLIPIINGLAKQQFSNASKPPGLSSSLVTLYLISEKVKILGANVYEVFCQ